jgi:hypothetical protein
MKNISSLIFTFLIGGFLLYLGGTSFIKNYDLIQHSTKTIGYVRNNIRHQSRKSTHYSPLIEFKTADGQTHTFESSFSSNPAKYSVDQPVEIIYNTSSPQNAEINNPLALWQSSALLTTLGLVLLIFPTIQWIKGRKGLS